MGSVPFDLAMSNAKRKYIIPYANEDNYKYELLIEICVSKFKSWMAFKSAGIQVPENFFIYSESDLQRAFKELGDSNGTIWLREEAMAGGGAGSIPTNDYEMARAWIKRYDGWGKFIAAQMLGSHTITWLSIWYEGELIVAQTRKRTGWVHGNRSASGVTGVTKVGDNL